MVGINICAKLSMNYTTFDQIYLYTNSIRGHRCPISHIDALSMPFSMGDEKASISMPGYNRRCPVAPLELGNWNFERMFTTHNMSQVMCHVSRVTYHVSRVTCHVFFVVVFLQIGEAYWWRVCYQPGLPRLVLTQCYNLHTSRELVSPVCGIFLWGISNSHSLFFKKLSPPRTPQPHPKWTCPLIVYIFLPSLIHRKMDGKFNKQWWVSPKSGLMNQIKSIFKSCIYKVANRMMIFFIYLKLQIKQWTRPRQSVPNSWS